MKKIAFTLALLPAICFAQSSNNSISFLLGGEYKSEIEHAWNIDIHYTSSIKSSKRWSAEFGTSLSFLEFKGSSSTPSNVFGDNIAGDGVSIDNNGYLYGRQAFLHYRKRTQFRLQAGINFKMIAREKFSLAIGSKLINQIELSEKQHGSFTYSGPQGNQVPDYFESTFSSHSALPSDILSLRTLQHLDASFRLTNDLWLKTRIGYYLQLAPGFDWDRGQFNLGISYAW